jgi:small conductance mechanosensitive channel
VVVMLNDTPLGTHYKLKAYPFDMRGQFHFIRGKLTIADSGAVEVQAMPGFVEPRAV